MRITIGAFDDMDASTNCYRYYNPIILSIIILSHPASNPKATSALSVDGGAEASPYIECDDGSLPEDNIRKLGPALSACGKRPSAGNNVMKTQDARRLGSWISMKKYKWPIGPWARDKPGWRGCVGMEGWAMVCYAGAPGVGAGGGYCLWRVEAELQRSPRYHIL